MSTVSSPIQPTIEFSTPLGGGLFSLVHFAGQEQLSEPFRYEVEFVTEQADLDPRKLIGQPVSFRIQESSGPSRGFHAYLVRIHRLDGQGRYRAWLVPWLWFLSQSAGCRVFQEQSIPEIAAAVFQKSGFRQFETKLQGNYPKLDYCVQYRESDLQFVSRLLEQAGIYYYFRQSEAEHSLVLADTAEAYQEAASSPLIFAEKPEDAGGSQTIVHWERRFAVCPHQFTQLDYAFSSPGQAIAATAETNGSWKGPPTLEVLEYPGESTAAEGHQHEAQVWMESESLPADTAQGRSLWPGLMAGGKFPFESSQHGQDSGKSYVATSVQHTLICQPGEEPVAVYSNTFECIPAEIVYRPPRQTPRPTIAGLQTAEVVGPEGEATFTDDAGRVKVKFLWDRTPEKDEHASCWVRVSQAWNNFQSPGVPRIGQEVVVSFLDGDPNRPLITGFVYHGEALPPAASTPEPAAEAAPLTKPAVEPVPAAAAETDGEHRNNIYFDQERAHLHAEHDFDLEVEGESRQLIKQDSKLAVAGDVSCEIRQNFTEVVGKDKTVTVHGNASETVQQHRQVIINGKLMLAVADDEHHQVQENRTTQIKKREWLQAGKAILIESGESLVLKAGGSSIELSADGKVTIKGEEILLEGNGKTKVVSAQNLVLKGKKIIQN